MEPTEDTDEKLVLSVESEYVSSFYFYFFQSTGVKPLTRPIVRFFVLSVESEDHEPFNLRGPLEFSGFGF